jgi:Zn-dependent protease with chaperone function
MTSVASHRRLVERLERSAARSPGAYRFKLALLAVAGYAVLAVALVLALALSLGLGLVLLLTKSVWAIKLIKLVWIPLVLAWLILKALWVKIPEPEGRRLRPGEAPALEREIERLRREAGAPPLAGIVIDTDLNAAAASVPRLLGLAGNRHFLVLGLPLLRVMSPDEMASVIAHEFGHFGGGHGRFAGWIYRVRQSWFRLLDALQQQRSAATGLFVRFFDWYAPYFNAYSFVLARNNEYEADAVAARLVGAPAAGRALVRVNLAAQRLHGEFWPRIDRLALVQPEPPAALYAEMARSLAEPAASDAEGLARALASTPTLDDTHPVLSLRLSALGVPAELAPPPPVSAAQAWLGPLADQLQAEFDQDWHRWVGERWSQRHQGHAAARERHAVLAAQRDEGGQSPPERLEWAQLCEQLGHDGDVLPLYEEALAAAPDSAAALWSVASLHLERDDPAGLPLAERAIALDPEFEPRALQLMADFHYRRNEDAAHDAVAQRLRAWHARQARHDAERGKLGKSDRYRPHDLAPGERDALEAAFRSHGKIKKAWVVRKEVPGGGPPHFVVVVDWRGMVLSSESELERLVALLELPGSVFVLEKPGNGANARRVIKAAGDPLFRH